MIAIKVFLASGHVLESCPNLIQVRIPIHLNTIPTTLERRRHLTRPILPRVSAVCFCSATESWESGVDQLESERNSTEIHSLTPGNLSRDTWSGIFCRAGPVDEPARVARDGCAWPPIAEPEPAMPPAVDRAVVAQPCYFPVYVEGQSMNILKLIWSPIPLFSFPSRYSEPA